MPISVTGTACYNLAIAIGNHILPEAMPRNYPEYLLCFLVLVSNLVRYFIGFVTVLQYSVGTPPVFLLFVLRFKLRTSSD